MHVLSVDYTDSVVYLELKYVIHWKNLEQFL